MAEIIKKDSLISEVYRLQKELITLLKNQENSDMVEVVRCEKCKYFFDECCNNEKNRVAHRVPDFGKHYSYVGGIKVEPYHYCGYGEPKEGENNA